MLKFYHILLMPKSLFYLLKGKAMMHINENVRHINEKEVSVGGY